MINIRNTALAVLIQTHTQWFQIAKRERERERKSIYSFTRTRILYVSSDQAKLDTIDIQVQYSLEY